MGKGDGEMAQLVIGHEGKFDPPARTGKLGPVACSWNPETEAGGSLGLRSRFSERPYLKEAR